MPATLEHPATSLPTLTNEEIARYSRHLILPEVGVRGDERGQAFVHGGARDRDSFLLVGVGAQRGGDVYFHGLIIAYLRCHRRALPFLRI